MVDLLEMLDIGTRVTRGRVRRVIGLTGAVLIFGWSQRWPVAYPLVQGAMDRAVERMTEAVTTSP